MPSAVFVSDIHIAAPDCPRARLFEGFLRTLSGDKGLTHLYLLGDIFDLWVADHTYFIDRYREIIGELRRLQSENVSIAYFEGNHDLYLRYFWGDELGATIHEGPCYVSLGETTVRLEHGDQMDPDDKGYIVLRWFLRTPPIRWLVRNLPGRLVARIGEKASAASRDYTTHKKTIDREDAIGKIRSHARRAYDERPFDIILCGHIHVRDDSVIDVDMKSFRTVNLGSWLDAPCYFSINDSEASFHEVSVQ